MENFLQGKVVLVTGSSRGVGAETSKMAAERGADIVINYRNKRQRAEQVAHEIKELGSKVLICQGDITEIEDMLKVFSQIDNEFGRLDILVLNASGGLEKDKKEDYAMRLNLDSQISLVNMFMPIMPSGGKLIFITSHWAHFFKSAPPFAGYEKVAESKYEGEQAIRKMIDQLNNRGIKLIVVSGQLIEDTITAKLLYRLSDENTRLRWRENGKFITTTEFSKAIVDAIEDDSLESGSTVYVGSTEGLL